MSPGRWRRRRARWARRHPADHRAARAADTLLLAACLGLLGVLLLEVIT